MVKNKINEKKDLNKPINKEELTQLIAPLEKKIKGIKGVWQKLKELVTTPIYKITWFTFIILLTFVFILTLTVTWNISNNRFTPTSSYGLLAKLDDLKQSHTYYTTMATKDELLISWIKSFSNWKYSSGGDPRYDKGDCIGAVYTFLRNWNSNIYFENVPLTAQRCENLLNRGEIDKRKTLNEVKTGDLVILQTMGKPDHVGIVYDVANGYIRYMDVNVLVQTWDLSRRRLDDKSIYGIYSVSYSFWLGDLMQQINKRI